MEKYEWLPTECAPRGFPARIVQGILRLEDGTVVTIPARAIVDNDWGSLGSVHLVGEALKAVPVRLEITWLSLSEDRFYGGGFDLPVAKLRELFQKKFPGSDTAAFSKVLVGLAPEGTLAVWVLGARATTEVALFKAPEASVEWKRVVDNGEITRREFIDELLKRSLEPAQLEALRTNGIPAGRWVGYARRYPWTPVIVSDLKVRALTISYFNGEKEWINFSAGATLAVQTRAVPRLCRLAYDGKNGQPMECVLRFDEEEISKAIGRLAVAQAPDQSVLQLEINAVDEGVRAVVVNKQHVAELKKCSASYLR